MNKRKVILIGFAVVAFHVLGIWALAKVQIPVKETPARPVDEFKQRTITYVDEAGQAQKVVNEFTVSTRLAGETSPNGPSPSVARP